MKTPREILLAAHRGAEPQLDRVREHALACALGPTRVQAHSRPLRNFARNLWVELIWPSRHAWATLAATWVVLAILNFGEREQAVLPGLELAPARGRSFANWGEQQYLLTLILANPLPRDEEPLPSPPPPSLPEKSAGAARNHRHAWA